MSSNTPASLGARIRAAREAAGLSQGELAARIPGVKQQSIDQVERGLVQRPRFLPELAEVLNTTTTWLLTGEGNAKRPASVSAMDIDINLLRDVYVALDKALGAMGLDVSVDHRAELIGSLYELVKSEEDRSLAALSKAAQTILAYDQIQRRSRK